MKKYSLQHQNSNPRIRREEKGTKLILIAIFTLLVFLNKIDLQAQALSGGWDASMQYGTSGIKDWGNGVIQLQTATFGQTAGAILETTSPYDPNSGAVFSKCYQVFFACPGNDGIGSDSKGDGAAFSFYKSSTPYNLSTNILATAGGLGYMGAVGDPTNAATKMISVEFDTYSSQGNVAFDAAFGGGGAGINDEISIHKQGDASDVGLVAGSNLNAGNLEDGKEHTICITYTPATTVLLVTIDGATKMNFNMGAAGLSLQSYFGAGGLNIAWSASKFGASSPITISNGASISSNAGSVIGLPNPIVADHTICAGATVPSFEATGTGFTSYLWSANGTGTASTTAGTTAGNYICTVTNAGGCSASDTGVLVINPLPIVVVADKSICAGTTTTFDAGNAGAIFAWTGPGGFSSTSQTPTVSVGGTYTVTVTWNGCSASDNALLTVKTLPVVNVADKSICGGSTTFDAGNAGATFAWTGPNGFSSTAQTPTVSTTGTYSVTVSTNGCSASDNALLTVNTEPIVIVADQAICAGSAVFDAGNAGATFAWTGPGGFTSTAQNPTVSSTGTYSVTVTANGCSASDNAVLSLSTALTVAVADQSICAGTSTTFDAANVGATYTWTGPGGYTSSAQTPTVSVDGVYSVTVTSGLCSASDNATLTVKSLPTVSLVDKAICLGSTTTLDAGNAGGSFSWTGPNSFTSTAQKPTVTAAGTYTVTVTVNGCSANGSAVLSVNILPTVSVADKTICNGNSTTFDAENAGATYAWTGPGGFNSTSQTPSVSTAGTYSVTVIDGNSCSATDNAVLTVNNLPIVSVADKAICVGASTTFDAGNVGATYAWTGPNGFSSSAQTPTVSVGGTYSVSVTANACSASDDALLTINNLPVVSLGSDKNICPGSNVVLDAGAGFTYLWNDASTAQTLTAAAAGLFSVTVSDINGCKASSSVNVAVSNTLTVDLGPTQKICKGDAAVTFDAGHPGSTYLWSDASTASTLTTNIAAIYTVDVVDNNGCAGKGSVELKVNDLPIVNVSDKTICQDLTTTFDAGNVGCTFAWTGPNAFSKSTGVITVKDAGSYTVLVSDVNSCKASASASLIVNNNPSVTLGSDYLDCSGTTATFDAGNIGATYLWNTNATSQTIAVTGDGTYSVVVTDGNGCSGNASVNAKFIEVPTLEIGNDIDLCSGESKVIIASVTPPTSVIKWSTAEVGTSILVNAAATITATANNGGSCSAVDHLEVFVHELPTITPLTDSTVCFVQLENGLVLDAGVNAAQYNWSDGQSGQSISVTKDGTYTVDLISAFGCVNRDTVVISEDCPSSLFVANAFTPNNDGNNDVFYVKGENIYDFELFIFDRWGEVIYHGKDMNEGWNGKKYNDLRDAQVDVYVWKISYKYWSDWKHHGKSREEVGRVTLLK